MELNEMKYRALIERFQTLQGSNKYLKAHNEALLEKYNKELKEKEEYQKAFNEIFIEAVGEIYDKLTDNEKISYNAEKKVQFFKDYFSKKNLVYREILKNNYQVSKEKIEKLENKIKELEKTIEVEKQFDFKKKDKEFKKDITILSKNSTKSEPEIIETPIPPINKTISSTNEHEQNRFKDENKPFSDITEMLSNSLFGRKNNNIDLSSKPKESQNITYDKKPVTLTKSKEPVNTDEIWKNITKNELEIISNNEFDEIELEIIKQFGKTGFYKVVDIIKDIKDVTTVNCYNAINTLKEKNIIMTVDGLKSSGPGKPPVAYKLTNIGYIMAHKLLKENPKVSLLDIAKINHKSLNHGDGIKTVQELLEQRGYLVKLEDSKMTSFGKESVCDLLATKNNISYRIEYEEGNYSDEGYYNKFNNINDITDKILFVVRNKNVKEKLINLFDKWVAVKYTYNNSKGERINGRNVFFKEQNKTFKVITLEELKNDKNFPN